MTRIEVFRDDDEHEVKGKTRAKELSEATTTKEELGYALGEPPYELEKLRQSILESLDKQAELTSAREIRAMSEEEFRGWFLSVDITKIHGIDVVKAMLERDMFAEIREQEKYQKNLEVLERFDKRHQTQYPGVPRILQDIKRVQEKEWMGEIERTIPFSPKVEWVITKIEDLQGVLYEVEGGKEKYNQLKAQVILWARIERLRPYMGEVLSITHVFPKLGLKNNHSLKCRLDVSDPVIPKIVEILKRGTETETRSLSEGIKEMTGDEADIRFLSCLVRNFKVIYEIVGTQTGSLGKSKSGHTHKYELSRAIFGRVEEIADQCYNYADSSYEILRAAEDAAQRTKIIPAEGTPRTEVAEAARELIDDEATDLLLEKVRAAKAAGTTFIIGDWETYGLVLRTLPMTLAGSLFDSHHREMKGRLLLRECVGEGVMEEILRSPHKLNPRFRFGRKAYGEQSFLVYVSRLEGFCNNHLESVIKQYRLLEKGCIRTIQDIQERLDCFYHEDVVRERSTFQSEIERAEHYLILYPLLRVGSLDSASSRELGRSPINDVLKLTIQIPSERPKDGWAWVDIARREKPGDDTRTMSRLVQVPTELRADNLGELVENLGIPKEVEERERYFRVLEIHGVSREQLAEWKERFGEVETLEQKMDALAYLVGIMLSDGTVNGGAAKLELSSSYYWSKEMGEHFLYYWCCLGVLIKKGSRQFRSIDPRTFSLFPTNTWITRNSGFLKFFHEKVLCLPKGGTHTKYCSKAEWILEMPREFRIAVIQGIFDGDGAVNSLDVNKWMGVAAVTQTPFVRKLLDSVGVQSTGGSRYINIVKDFQLAVELPVFRSATGRQEVVERQLKIVSSRTRGAKYNKGFNLPYRALICKLGSNTGRSHSRIAQLLYDLTGTTSKLASIRLVLEKGDLKVDWVVVRAYFEFQRMKPHKGSISGLVRRICKKTGIDEKTRFRDWLGEKIPLTVRHALSEACPTGDGGWVLQPQERDAIHLDRGLLERCPHIEKIIAFYQSQNIRVREALERDYDEMSSHPRLDVAVQRLERELKGLEAHLEELEKPSPSPDSVDALVEAMRTVQEIGKLREPVGTQYLTPLLEYRNLRIRGVAVKALGKTGGREAVDALIKTYPKEPLYLQEDTKRSTDLRVLWIMALGRISDPRATSLLSETQNDPDAQIKQASIKALNKTRRAQERATEEEKISSPSGGTFTETLQSDAREEIVENRLETQEGKADIHRTTTQAQEPPGIGRTIRDEDVERHPHSDKRAGKEETSLEAAPVDPEIHPLQKDKVKSQIEAVSSVQGAKSKTMKLQAQAAKTLETLQRDPKEEITELRHEPQESEASIHRSPTHTQERLEVRPDVTRSLQKDEVETPQRTAVRAEMDKTGLEAALIEQEPYHQRRDRAEIQREAVSGFTEVVYRDRMDFATRVRVLEDLLTKYESVSPEYRREAHTARIASQLEKLKHRENFNIPHAPKESPLTGQDSPLPRNSIRFAPESVSEAKIAALERQVSFMQLVMEYDQVTGRDKVVARYDRIDSDIERLRIEMQQERPRENPLLKDYTESSGTPPTRIARQEVPRPIPPTESSFEARIDSLDNKIEALRESTQHRTVLDHEVREPLQGEALPHSQITDRGAVQVFERVEETLRENPPSPDELRVSDAFLESVETDIDFLRKIDGLEQQVEELKQSPSSDDVGGRLEALEHEIEQLHENTTTLEEKDTSLPFEEEGREGESHVPHSDFKEDNPFAEAEQAIREEPPSPEELRESDANIESVQRSMIDWEEDSGEGWSEGGFSG